MSTRRLSVEVVGNASSFYAMMNRMTQGVSKFGAGLRSSNRDTQQSSKYLMALGTTLRYAFAGRVLFGIQNAINNLGEFKTQLGEIDALAGQFNKQDKWVGLGSQLDEVGKSALLMSNRFGIAVGDVETYMQRFFSSFNPGGSAKSQVKQMNDYTNSILNLASAIGSEAGDPQKLASGLTGLINALPGGRKNPGKAAETISNYFAAVLKATPGLTGADIATAAGRFASAKSLARMSVPDILSVFGVAAQTGGSPAVIIRGMTQLLGQSLLHPTRPQSLRTYEAAGLPTDPNMLAKLGGTKVLDKLISFVQSGGPQGSKGRQMNLDAIYNAFSRQESVRQFVNILANGGVPAIKEFSDQLKKANKENLVKKMADVRLQQSLLMRMRNAGTNAGIALLAGADWPLENLVARPTIYASNAMIRHPKATQIAVSTALGLGAANSLRRLGAFNGRFGGLGRFLGAANTAEQALVGGAISKEELPAAISGGATDGTRANPFWVVISPLSWSLGSPTGGGSSSGGVGGGFLGKLPLGLAGRVAGGIGAGFILGKGLWDYMSNPSKAPKGGKSWSWAIQHPVGSVESTLGDIFGRGNSTFDRAVSLKKNQPLLAALTQAGLVNQYLHGQIQRITFEGNPKADLTIKLVDQHGKTISIQEQKGVPIIPKAKVFPSSQGKAGSRKGST